MGALAFALDLSFSHATLLLQDVGIFRSVCWVLPAFMLKSVWEKVARSIVLERPFTDGGTVVVCAANTLWQWMHLFQQNCAFYCLTAQSCGAGEKWYLQKPGLEGSGVCDSCAGVQPKRGCDVSHGFYPSHSSIYSPTSAKVTCAHVAGMSSAAVSSRGILS